MWAVRRASAQLRNQGLTSRISRICCAKTEIAKCCSETCNAGVIEPQDKNYDVLLSSARFYSSSAKFLKSPKGIRSFSSQADSGEDNDDLEDGFSELETSQDTVKGIEDDDAGSEDSEDEGAIADEVLEASDTDTVNGGKKEERLRSFFETSEMTKAILASPTWPVNKVLDKWIEEGNEVTKTEASVTMLQLQKRRLHVKALQLSEWLESTNQFEFTEANYAARADLIAKVQGIFKAENYVKKIPESFRTELVYRTLLANCVASINVGKAEELFNKMKSLGFPLTCFTCNQLLILYKRTDRKKIADVLLMMEKEDIKPSIFTYQVLIDVKGGSNDIKGMEQIVETMKADGLKPDDKIQASIAQYYVNSGLKDKAKDVLKEMEGDDLEKKRHICALVIPIYASLGSADDVERIWRICKSNPRMAECIAAIDAWGQLKKIEKAEEAFAEVLKKVKMPTSKHFTPLLKVYANNKMLAKGKDLLKRMGESGCLLGPLAWDALVKLYVGAGEVEKAASILSKAMKQKKGKPLFSSFMTIMDKHSEGGDVHGCEKMFQMMREAGYTARARQYTALLRAYINSKTPAYGFADRLKADNLFPNRSLSSLLAQADAFKKSAVSELLE